MREEEFDLNALNNLIDSALEDKPKALPGQTTKDKLTLSFAFNDTRLLEVLAESLPTYMHQADVQTVLDKLRTELYHSISLGNLREMHGAIQHCRKCTEVTPTPTLPQWNLSNPDVVFVADNAIRIVEVDKFFVDSLVQAGFSSKNVCLTYATRCPIKGRVPEKDELNNCSSYLYTEIQMLQPKLIVTMGNSASSLFIGSTKITEDHGKIFWIGPWPVMPMLSPGYTIKAGNTVQFEDDLANAYRFVYGSKL